MRGIYKITNKVNNKVYIGESLDIERRWKDHIYDLNDNTHHSYKLQNDWNTYGQNNFKFEIISVIDESISKFIDKYILIIYESKYIKEFNSISEGYNIEETMDKVANKEKIIMDEYKDSYIIKGYKEKIMNGIIKESNGIIYKEIFTFHDILKYFNFEYGKLRMLLTKNNIVIKNGDKRDAYVLNEEVFNKEDIVLNKDYSHIKFHKKLYLNLIDKIQAILIAK